MPTSTSCEKVFTITVPSDFYGYWKCEEAALPIVDSTGNRNFTTAVGAGTVMQATGKISKGIYLAHGVNYLNISTGATNRFSFSDDFTLRFWIYCTGSNSFVDIINNDLAGDYSFQADLVNDSPGVHHIDFTVYDALNISHRVSSGSLAVGWHRIMCWYQNGIEIAIKLDNAAEVTAAETDGTYTPTSPGLVLGSVPVGLPTDYILDEIAIWDRVLSNAEMTTDWNYGNGTTYPTI